MKIRNHWLLLCFLLSCVGGAEANFTYDYNATCSSDCVVVGLSDGDPVSGFIEFSETNFAPNAVLDATDVVAFSLTAGNVTVTELTSIGWFFVGILADDGISFDVFALSTSDSLDPDRGNYINAGWFSGLASPEGACLEAFESSELCQSYTWNQEVGYAELAGGTLIRRNGEEPPPPAPAPATPIPAIGAVGLGALSLLIPAIAWRRTRRRNSRG